MISSRYRLALGGAGIALILAGPALAQSRGPLDRFTQLFGRSPPPDSDDDAPTIRPESSGNSVRIDRLENQLRSLTGQIEQLQFSVRQLQDQLRQTQTAAPPVRRSEEGVPAVVAQTTPLPAVTPSTTPGGGETGRLRRSDAFDPATAPGAPGAPRQIGTLAGTTVPGTPVSQTTRLPGGPVGSDTPMDLSGGRIASNGTVVEPSRGPIASTALPTPLGASQLPQPGGVGAAPVVTTPGGTVIASHEPFSPKEEFETAVGYLKGGQYEAAEKGFSTFLQKNPKNRLVAEAVFDLGESYFQRGRHREAAEQYLKISTTYSTSSRAPDAMLRLGQSLGALGAKEQACASFGEIARKYPTASPTVRASAEREAKKNQC